MHFTFSGLVLFGCAIHAPFKYTWGDIFPGMQVSDKGAQSYVPPMAERSGVRLCTSTCAAYICKYASCLLWASETFQRRTLNDCHSFRNCYLSSWPGGRYRLLAHTDLQVQCQCFSIWRMQGLTLCKSPLNLVTDILCITTFQSHPLIDRRIV